MDIKVENQFKENLKTDVRQFISFYDEYFSDVYRFVKRRVDEDGDALKLVELIFLDAFGQCKNVPSDFGFQVWLYRLAWERVERYVRGNVVSLSPEIKSPIFDGASLIEGVYDDEMTLKKQAESFFASLSVKEREIVRLKFFEEVTDGDVKYILGIEEAVIGPTIYQVLKRGYAILFGETEENRGVYFGELQGFLSRLKRAEKIPMDEGFKLSLKLKIQEKVDSEIGAQYAGAATAGAGAGAASGGVSASGSSDPAKIFVEAAKGMSREEADRITEEYVKERSGTSAEVRVSEEVVPSVPVAAVEVEIEAEEVPVKHYDSIDEYDDGVALVDKLRDMFDRWRYVFSAVPSLLFVIAVAVVTAAILFGRIDDEGVTGLAFEIDYEEGFEEFSEPPEELADYEERLHIENTLVALIADGKDVESVEVNRVGNDIGEGEVLKVDFKIVKDGWLEYKVDIREGAGDVGEVYKLRSYKKIFD